MVDYKNIINCKYIIDKISATKKKSFENNIFISIITSKKLAMSSILLYSLSETNNFQIKRIFILDSNKIAAGFKTQTSELKLINKICENLIKRLEYGCAFEYFEYLDFSGWTIFQKKVLMELYAISKFGETLKYSELSKKIFNTNNYSRAIGNALAFNPFPIVFPCHRVIRANSDYGNFQISKQIKKRLLDYEKNFVA